MRLRPYTGLSLAAVVVATTVGVAAQNSNTNAGATGARVSPSCDDGPFADC